MTDAIRGPMFDAIGWALLQFVWQGALVAAVTAALLAVLARRSAALRYGVACVALAVMAALPPLTAMFRAHEAAVPSDVREPGVASPDVVAAPEVRSQLRAAFAVHSTEPADRAPGPGGDSLSVATLDTLLPIAVLVWLAGVALLSVRLLSGWLVVQRLRRAAARCAPPPCHAQVVAIARRLRVSRPVRTFESALVAVPTVVGWLRPVILLPASALTCLSPAQVEAIIAHEIAHIRRHDYLVNLLQTIVETLLFYHPAVWWLSRRIRVEREHCCDDVAVAVCADRVEYARALASLEELRALDSGLALAASGGSLLSRVRRLVADSSSDDEPSSAWLPACAAACVVAFVLIGSDTATSASKEPELAPTPREWLATSTAQDPPMPVPPPPPSPPRVPRPPRTPRQADAPPEPLPPLPMDAPAPPIRPSAPLPPAPPREPAPVAGLSAPLPAPPASVAPLAPVPPPAAVPTQPAPAAPVPPAAPGAMPAPPAQPAPPAPPAPPASGSFHQRTERSEGHISWSNNGERMDVHYRGTFDISDDDRDVVRMTPGGYLTIAERRSGLGDRRVELRADAAGTITRSYFADGRARPWEQEGKAWLAGALPRLVRRAGFAAEARVARIFKAQGASGVLAEISRLESDHVRSRYFRLLFEQGTLADADRARALRQAGAGIRSDYELAEVLLHAARGGLATLDVQAALVDAGASIESDYELRRVLDHVTNTGKVPAPPLARMLQLARTIDSDYELASLLVTLARTQSLDSTVYGPYFEALALVGSDYEARRVLDAVLARSDSAPVVPALLGAATHVESAYELAEFLTAVAWRGLPPDARVPFFRAADTIQSAHERGRVLRALAGRSDLSAEMLPDLLKSASGITSGHELASLLVEVAARHPLEGAARDAYVSLAERAGKHDQQRVLAALAKGERR